MNLSEVLQGTFTTSPPLPLVQLPSLRPSRSRRACPSKDLNQSKDLGFERVEV